ncbi:hypothetical protein AB6J97_002122 [Raoultella ornithinolytica]|uniref:hypothetical protein n=2 Tax=Raoultella ornithinolytica TaxID=54291 RepID=UPI000FEBFB8C|nr:hypothetical protein [Raoultella ornithinolytica]EKW7679526.1 hypothetical protein [Raoultella ornithinolytica]ELN4414100.1 hypothetical protein [Raoultella ornithinolytica]MCF6681963.1 hypothetical protein [Raoultella ornithinolytica]MEB4600383.1 hypothetical protein [Raoultella ornithinolytica]HED4147961.1 hypothetical protein [Raoultella ornithinolytica]
MPMDDMDSGQQVKEGMMSAAVSFLRYFLLKIVSADYFYELCPGVHRNKPSFFLYFTHYPNASSTVFSAGNTAISPAIEESAEENPEAVRHMTPESSEFS